MCEDLRAIRLSVEAQPTDEDVQAGCVKRRHGGVHRREPVGRDTQAARRGPQHTRQGESRETRSQDVLGPLQGLSGACVARLCAWGWG